MSKGTNTGAVEVASTSLLHAPHHSFTVSLEPPEPKMRCTLYFCCVLTVVAAVVATGPNPADMPDFVREFEETKDMWERLWEHGLLPGHHNAASGTPPTNSWIDFVKARGGNIIHRAWVCQCPIRRE